jgi:hypothetical protein
MELNETAVVAIDVHPGDGPTFNVTTCGVLIVWVADTTAPVAALVVDIPNDPFARVSVTVTEVLRLMAVIRASAN